MESIKFEYRSFVKDTWNSPCHKMQYQSC